MSNMDIDQNSREKIRQDISHNFFVEAGAGSGKTSVLVDRMVAMVEGGLDISKISAITFTKAAAGEFYERFQKKLSESNSELAKKALNDIDLCFMGTIDSFCNMVLSEHPMAAQIPSNSLVLEDDEMEKLYLREYSAILQGAYGDSELHALAERFAGAFYNAGAVFVKGMKIMAANKNAHMNYSAPITGTIDDSLGERRTRLIEILTYCCKHEEIMQLDKNNNARTSYEALLESINLINDSWNDNLDDIQKKLKELKNLRIISEFEDKMDELGPGWEQYFTPHYTRNKLAWFEINNDEDALLVNAIGNIRFSLAVDFVSKCLPLVSAKLKSEGKLSFSDYLLYLRDTLKLDAAAEGKLIKHIYERHSYFFIDEFQDTNPIQAEVFFYLTAKEPKENWRECIPQPGSLFIVGDPKQSIYRFRNADVASFLKVRELFNNSEVGEVLYMTRNFRSTDNMCSWFNKAFSNLLPADTEDQSKFNEIPTGEKPEYKATLEGAYGYDIAYTKSFDDSEDPDDVAKIIMGIINNSDATIQDVKTGEIRRAEFNDFMLITPAKTHMKYYMNKFAEYGIPFRIEGKVLFNECEALQSISYIMQAIADPFDAKSVFAAINLSGCKLDIDTIHEYSFRSKGMSPAAVFSMILDEARVFGQVGTHNAEYVYFALELLRSASIDGTVSSIKEAAEYIANLVADKSGLERCLQLRSDSNRVHIANLHKVKGLQAPIVILADPKHSNLGANIRVDYSADKPEAYIFGFDNTLKTTDFATEQEKEKAVLEGERLRLLYVAATRAANVLIISNLCKSNGETSDSSMWINFQAFIDRSIFDAFESYELPAPAERDKNKADELYDKADNESALNSRDVEKSTYTLKKPSTITLKGVTSSEDDYEDKAADEIKQIIVSKRTNEQALLLGTMVHKIMESLVSSHNAYDRDNLVTEVLNEFEAEEEVFSKNLKDVVDTIRKGGYEQSNDVPKDILTELLSADEVHCELPFCYKEENLLWHGVMDVAYLKDGKWHIVDYKTNVDADDLDEHYKEQLEAYIKAFKEMTGEEADAMTYHIEV